MKNIYLCFQMSILFALAPIHARGQAWEQLAGIAGGVQAPAAVNPVAAVEPAAAELALSPVQKKRADMLISVFENSTLAPQYAYIENMHDGRGYTAGRAGFCSGCGDMLLVAERYAQLKPGNPLAKYLPRLTELARLSSASTKGLEGFPAAWERAARDPLFRGAQDAVSDELYYLPALEYSRQLGLQKDFSQIALYEAAIQHGIGDDPDGLPAMIKKTSQAAEAPADGGDEKIWLEQFLKVRRATLAYAADPETREAWAESVGRADAMLAIAAAGNMDFSGAITINPYGQKFIIPGTPLVN